MSVSGLMQVGAAGVPDGLLVYPSYKFTNPFENATVSQQSPNRNELGDYAGLAGNSYSSSDYSWDLTSLPVNFAGFTCYIDWDIPNQNGDILFVVAVSGMGTVFNTRGAATIGVSNNDLTKFFKLERSGYNSDNTNYWVGYLSYNTRTETPGEYTVTSETSAARPNWYMGFRYSMQNGAFKGYKSYDSGSTWSLVVSGTHANYADMTKAFISIYRRTGTGGKIAMLNANLYKDDIVL